MNIDGLALPGYADMVRRMGRRAGDFKDRGRENFVLFFQMRAPYFGGRMEGEKSTPAAGALALPPILTLKGILFARPKD